MAGDWIKMRCDLQTHPKIVRIMSATSADRFRVVGGLHAVWCVFDAHSTDGRLTGYTPDLLDQIVGWPGLSAAMLSVGWLAEEAEALVMPEFSEHNGKGAKRRAEDTKQKRERRKSAENQNSVGDLSADDADTMRTREEKRREEKKEQEQSLSKPSASDRAERLAQVTEDAIETFNAAPFTKAQGGNVPNVSQVGREKRRQQVARCSQIARDIVKVLGLPGVNREFWEAYWATVDADPFASGRQGGSGAHANWVPDFDYLTRPATMAKLFDKAAS